MPPQVQIVWDNLNLRMKHRFERKDDCYTDFNYDWMASLFILERIRANHMEHETGKSFLDPSLLKTNHFIPNKYEKSYMFSRVVSQNTNVP